MKVLVDHDIEGHAVRLWQQLAGQGWLDLIEINMVTFLDVGLDINSSDREVWRFAQANAMILLTNNRNMKDKDSLEQTLRDENSTTSLPVLTISNVDRLRQKTYCLACATEIVEVVLYLEDYLGRSRVFIPNL